MGNTILLADKSITIQKIVELTFSDDEYTIKCVNDGQSALEAIPQIRPDIILADISLPVKNGYELCQAIRNDPAFAEFSQIPVILLAGIYETMDEERAKAVEEKVREVGANDLLSKPFDPQLLTTKVKDLMHGAVSPQITAEMAKQEPIITQAIFTQSSQAPETAPADEFYSEPPEDSDTTLMLPGPPVFSNTMFAETPPFEAEHPELEVQQTVKIESVTPLNEPVFDASQLQALPEELPELPAEEPEVIQEPETGMFAGREETEFTFDTPVETYVTQPQPAVETIESLESQPAIEPAEPAPVQEESLFELEEEAKTAPQPVIISPPAEEPFGDVFDTPQVEPQWSASEEDSPFGLPEPPPAPPQPEPVAEEPPVEVLETKSDMISTGPELSAPITELWGEIPSGDSVPAAVTEEDREELEEIIGDSELKPDFGEDTWSRAKAMSGEQTVEELFEAEPAVSDEPRIEEAEELEADFQEAEAVVESTVLESQAAPAPVASGAPVQITEDLIERIVERVINRLSERVVSDIVWQVVPDLAEKMIRRELEKLQASEE
jgi:CheY-like chemotaxis protein